MLDKFEEFLKSQNKSLNTAKGQIRAVREYFKWFSETYDKEPVEIIKQNVDEYRCTLQTSMHQVASTINYKLSSLKKYNEFLVAVGVQKDIVITNNMMLKIRGEFVSSTVITEKDVNLLRQVILEHGSKRDYALVNLFAYTGIRISQALDVRLADCNNINETKQLTIREMKSKYDKCHKQQGIVYLNDKAISSLEDYITNERNICKSSSDNEFLFVSNKNRNLDRITVNKMLNKYCFLGKLPHITPLQLRHFFLSNALERRVTSFQGGICEGSDFPNNCVDNCICCSNFIPDLVSNPES